MTLNELHMELKKFNIQMKHLIRASRYDRYDDLSGLDLSYIENDGVSKLNLTSDEYMLLDEFRGIMDKLDTVSRIIDYISRPIKGEYILHLNPNSKYYECIGQTYTCGTGIEFCYYDDWEECCKWAVSRVEYSHGNEESGYYIVGYPKVKLEGLKVRVRDYA